MISLKAKYHIAAALKKIFYKAVFGHRVLFGKGTTFRSGFHLMVEKNGHVDIGKRCFFNHDCSISCLRAIHIGDDTIFGEGVRIYDHNHKFADFGKRIKEQGFVESTVHIGSNCWIGSNVVLLRKTEIGDHCVIGAGCVINRKIPAGSIVTLDSNTVCINPIQKRISNRE